MTDGEKILAEYVYSASGNPVVKKIGGNITSTYAYDELLNIKALKTETSTTQPEMIRYTYDRQGNMLSEKSMKSGEEKKYSYDSFGRMVRAEVSVESPGTREFQVQINRYDGEGLRHEMEENGRLIKFLYNKDREVVAEETSNGTITRYIRGLGIISSDSEEAKTYYHYVSDEQGSITHVLSEDAEILNHYSYDAFGNIIEKTEKVENRFCYNGEMLDPVTQQYYLRARFYNPVIGRFTQEDTYYGDGLNLYQYCQANPVGYVDPSGHNCGTTQSRYNSNEEQHPKANAAGAYQSATEKKSVKKDGSESGTSSTTAGFDDWLGKGATDNKVYFGMKDGTAQYTGITKQTKNARLNQHNNAGKGFDDLDIQYEGLTRNQARAIEQYYIENGPNALNKINSISPNNKYYQDAMNWAKQYLGVE